MGAGCIPGSGIVQSHELAACEPKHGEDASEIRHRTDQNLDGQKRFRELDEEADHVHAASGGVGVECRGPPRGRGAHNPDGAREGEEKGLVLFGIVDNFAEFLVRGVRQRFLIHLLPLPRPPGPPTG